MFILFYSIIINKYIHMCAACAAKIKIWFAKLGADLGLQPAKLEK